METIEERMQFTVDRSLPKRGLKKLAPTIGLTESESNEVQKLLDERSRLLSEEKSERLNCLLQGEWLPDQMMVHIKKNVGKHFFHMGVTVNGKNMLYPEEALFLMDLKCMEVYFNDMPISMQEGYELFLNSSLGIECYQVYAHLSRLGYIVVRHNNQWFKSKTSANTLSKGETSQQSVSDNSVDLQKVECSSVKTIDNVFEECLLVKHPDIVFPNVHHTRQITLTCPDKSLLPENVFVKEICTLNLNNIARDSWKRAKGTGRRRLRRRAGRKYRNRKQLQNQSETSSSNVPSLSSTYDSRYSGARGCGGNSCKRGSDQMDDDHPGNVSRPNKKPRLSGTCQVNLRRNVGVESVCWKQFLLLTSRNRKPQSSAIELLSTVTTRPLVQPNDSANEVYQRLNVIEQRVNTCKCLDLLDISFDVHLPYSGFKKTFPSVPNHCVVVTRQHEQLPNVAVIERTMSHLSNKCAINFAVVDNGGIAFYTFMKIYLPKEISIPVSER